MNIHDAEPETPVTESQLRAACEALGLDYDSGNIRAVHLSATSVVVESLATTHTGDPVAAGEEIVTRFTVHPVVFTF